MDNITHTMIGVLASALVQTRIPKEKLTLRKAILLASVFGNNFPDLDFLLKPIAGAGSLGSLVHHRGFTHTLFMGVFSGILCGWIASRLVRHKGDQKLLFAVGILGNFLHVFADFWNDYGVHPFWPFYNGWFYGDMMFIVEPLLWFALLPLAYRASFTKWGRYGWTAIGIFFSGLILFTPYLSIFIKITLVFWAALQYVLQGRFQAPQPLRAFLCVVAILCVFGFTSRHVKKSLPEHAEETFLDTALVPAPSNPFCWRWISTHLTSQGDLISRVGSYSLWPEVFDPLTCHLRLADADARTAPLTRVPQRGSPYLYEVGERRLALSEYLGATRESKCGVGAFLTWSRKPFWLQEPEGTLTGDIRYDTDKEWGFTEMITTPEVCSRLPVPWEPPLISFLKKTGKL